MSPGVEVRALAGDEEFLAFLECDAVSFGDEVQEENVPLARAFLEPERTMGAFEGGRLVGSCANLSMEVTVPGPAVLRCTGVTYVSVLPSHRRRGVLTSMMGRLLDNAVDHGDPLAVLLASEGAIYGRFGFGPATQAATYEIDKAHVRLARPTGTGGTVRVVGRDEAATALPAIHAANRRRVPGNCSRSAGWWGWHLRDVEADREGASRMYHAVHEPAGGGAADGYVSWRVEQHWVANPDYIAIVVDHSAASPEVRLALLELVCGLDLVTRTRLRSFPVDEPFRWALVDSRRLLTTSVNDVLWVRLLDVPRCLAARSYAAADRLVLEVEDAFRPECGGRFALDTRGTQGGALGARGTQSGALDTRGTQSGTFGAACGPTTEPADLTVTASDLGTLYLGGVSASALADAGRIRAHRDDAVARAARLFATDRAPYGDTDF